MQPLENMIVLDFSQYLAGPSAALRLADMGARVIKIERPGSGDGSRQMKLHNLDSMGDSVLFQTINRNKQSFCADLKSPEDMNMVKKLIRRSDVMIENFRPGVMKKIGLDYETVKSINPRMVYGTVMEPPAHGTKNRDRTFWFNPFPGWHGSTVMTDSRPCRLPSPWQIPTPASIWRKALWPACSAVSARAWEVWWRSAF